MAVVKCFLSLVRLSGKSDQVLSGSIEWDISIGHIYSPDYFFFIFFHNSVSFTGMLVVVCFVGGLCLFDEVPVFQVFSKLC